MLIVKPLVQCHDLPLLPFCGSGPTFNLPVVLSESVVWIGTLADIDIVIAIH